MSRRAAQIAKAEQEAEALEARLKGMRRKPVKLTERLWKLRQVALGARIAA